MIGIAEKHEPGDVSIGKFDLLATYTYAKALLDGLGDGEAKERGMVAAVMGGPRPRAATRAAPTGTTKEAAEKKKKKTITAESFDRQVAENMGGFFKKTFLPTMKKLVKAGLSYDEVKKAVKIPTTWGAKISGEQFQKQARSFLIRHDES